MSNKQSQIEEIMASNNNFLELIHTLFQQMEKKIDRKLETMKLQHQIIHSSYKPSGLCTYLLFFKQQCFCLFISRKASLSPYNFLSLIEP